MERSLDEKVANQLRRKSRDAMGKDRDAIKVWLATRWKNVATRKNVLTSTRGAMDYDRDAIHVNDLGHTWTRPTSRRDGMGSRRDGPAEPVKLAFLNSNRPNV